MIKWGRIILSLWTQAIQWSLKSCQIYLPEVSCVVQCKINTVWLLTTRDQIERLTSNGTVNLVGKWKQSSKVNWGCNKELRNKTCLAYLHLLLLKPQMHSMAYSKLNFFRFSELVFSATFACCWNYICTKTLKMESQNISYNKLFKSEQKSHVSSDISVIYIFCVGFFFLVLGLNRKIIVKSMD